MADELAELNDLLEHFFSGVLREYRFDSLIAAYFAGEAPHGWRGGPVTETGFYVYPVCSPMCCRPTGPFFRQDEARAWASANLPDWAAHRTLHWRSASRVVLICRDITSCSPVAECEEHLTMMRNLLCGEEDWFWRRQAGDALDIIRAHAEKQTENLSLLAQV